MSEVLDVNFEDLFGVYKEMAEWIGVESTYTIFLYFQGQQVTFPKKFYSHECIAGRVKISIRRELQFGILLESMDILKAESDKLYEQSKVQLRNIND